MITHNSYGRFDAELDLVRQYQPDLVITALGGPHRVTDVVHQDHKLRFLPNALLLPHIGYVTAENYSKFYNQMLENLLACLDNKPLRVIS